MANIRDVARLAGVSISSVSNLLNNRSHQMSAQTRERIEQVMATTGYRPARAAALPAPQAKIIGLLLPSIVNPSFSALAHAVDGAARAHRYRVLLGNAYRQNRKRPRLSTICSCMACAASSWRRATFARPILSGPPSGA